jgi:hypothetical protein
MAPTASFVVAEIRQMVGTIAPFSTLHNIMPDAACINYGEAITQ